MVKLVKAVIFSFVLIFTGNLPGEETNFPELTGRVVDNGNILSQEARRAVEEVLRIHEEKSSQQLVVVTVKSLGGNAIEEYGYQLGRKWGIGEAKKNNGALLIVAPAEKKVRIEVGYGLEHILTDAVSRVIIESVIIPQFRRGNFEQGILNGAQAIVQTLALDEEGGAQQGSSFRKKSSTNGWTPGVLFLVPFVLIFLGISKIFKWLALIPVSVVLFLFFIKIISFILAVVLIVIILLSIFSSPLSGSGFGGPFSGPFGGSFGGGGFSGGGFSGGGGSFGGGGASGGW